MVSINLLAWREVRADYRQALIKKCLVGSLLLSWLLLMSAHIMLSYFNQRLTRQVTQWQVAIQAHPLHPLHRIDSKWRDAVNQWREQRQQLAALLALLGSWQPEGLCVSALHLTPHQYAIEGLSTSMDALRMLMVQWQQYALGFDRQWTHVAFNKQATFMHFDVRMTSVAYMAAQRRGDNDDH